MDKQIKDIINNLINEYEYVNEGSIPSIDLYMDQVTTFIDDSFMKYTDKKDEKLLTKTMINNYTKAGLLPRPQNKKYNKEHIILLILIYHYKNFVSIKDSKDLLDPIKNICESEDSLDTLVSVYEEICNNNNNCKKKLVKDINEKITYIEKNTKSGSSRDSLEIKEAFSLFNMLAYDVFNKKRIMDELISYIQSQSAYETDK